MHNGKHPNYKLLIGIHQTVSVNLYYQYETILRLFHF